MALYPAAVPKLIKHNFSKSGMSKTPKGLVVHVSETTTLKQIFNWFDTENQVLDGGPVKVSAHFAVGRDGTVWQFVDTDHQAFGLSGNNSNQNWISVETVGVSPASLSDEQIVGVGALLYWLNRTKHVPIRLAASSSEQGLAYHSIDKSWGRTGCPGKRIINQLPQVVESAFVGF